MGSIFLLLNACLIFSFFQTVSAQNIAPFWSLTGNSNSTATSKLGTTNAINLRLYTNNLERVRIQSSNGFVGINTISPTAYLTINTTPGTALIKALVNNVPKLYMTSAGGLSVGSGTIAPANGLLVVGMAGFGTAAPKAQLHVMGTSTVGLTNPGFIVSGDLAGVNLGIDGSQIQARYNNSYSTLYLNVSGGAVQAGNSTYSTYGVNATGNTYGLYGHSAVTGVLGEGGSGGYGGYFANNGGTALYARTTTNSQGVLAYTSGNGEAIHADAYGATAYGLYGYSAKWYGVVGITGNAASYAGYFQGAVFCTATYHSSDERLKQNIHDLSSAMSVINQLHPKQYQFKQDGDFQSMNLPQGEHYGLLAQEVEKILPSLVKDTRFETDRSAVTSNEAVDPKNPNAGVQQVAAKSGKTFEFKALNYTELIPIIIKGMQEQAVENDSLKKELQKTQSEVEELKTLVLGMKNSSGGIASSLGAYLEQNTPNPVKGGTTIRYHVPAATTSATLVLTNTNGQTIKAIKLGKGTSATTFNTASLSSGNYNYTLWVDGTVADTKQFIIAR